MIINNNPPNQIKILSLMIISNNLPNQIKILSMIIIITQTEQISNKFLNLIIRLVILIMLKIM